MENLTVYNLIARLEKKVNNINDCQEDERLMKIANFNTFNAVIEFLGTNEHYKLKNSVESNEWQVIGYSVKKQVI